MHFIKIQINYKIRSITLFFDPENFDDDDGWYKLKWCWCCRFGIERPDIYSPFFLILFPLISVPLVQHHQFPTQTSFSSSFPPPVFHPIFYPSYPRNFFLRSPSTSSHHQGRLFLIIGDCQLQAVKNERYLRIRRRKLNCDFSFLIVEPSVRQPPKWKY